MKTKHLLIPILCLSLSSLSFAQTWGPTVVLSQPGEVVNSLTQCRLSNEHFVVAYADAKSGAGTAVVARMERGEVSELSRLKFDADGKIAGGSPLALVPLSASRFLLLYQDTKPVGYALLGEVSASGQLSWAGPPTDFSSPSKATHFTGDAINPNLAILAFHGESNKQARVRALAIGEDGSLTLGPDNVFMQGQINAYNALSAQPDGSFVLAYTQNSSGGKAFARAGRIDGASVRIGPPMEIDARNSPFMDAATFGGGRVLAGYHTGEGHQLNLLRNENGTLRQISKTVPGSAGFLFRIDRLDNERFLYSFRNDSANRRSDVWLGRIKGDNLEASQLASLDKGASLPIITALHDRVAIFSHVAANQVETQALAVPGQ
jgi:hypothetical protein